MIDNRLSRVVAATVRALLSTGSHTATSFVSDRLTVRATRVLLHGKVPTGRLSRYDIALTIGRPNFSARAFIKKAKQAGEPFRIRKVQLKAAPVSRTKR